MYVSEAENKNKRIKAHGSRTGQIYLPKSRAERGELIPVYDEV